MMEGIMGKLYCVALGESSRSLFYDELQSIGVDNGVLVLPSRNLMQKAQREANVRTIDLDYLADAIIRDNYQGGLKRLNQRNQDLIIQNILNDEGKNLKYYNTILGKKGLLTGFKRLFSQLFRAGIDSDTLKDALSKLNRTDVMQTKDSDTVKIYERYCKVLEKNNWIDLEGKFQKAISMLKNGGTLRWQNVFVSDFHTFNKLQIEFLREIDKHCNLSIGIVYEAGINSSVFEAVDKTYNELTDFCVLQDTEEVSTTKRADALEHLLRRLRNKGQVEPVNADGKICTCKLTDRDAEVRWVLSKVKELLKNGVSAKDILVTFRSFENYQSLREVADEYGIPVSLPQTTLLAIQPLTKFLQLVLESYNDTREGALAYCNLLSSEFGKDFFGFDGETVYKWREETYFTSRSFVNKKCQDNFGEDAGLKLVDELIAKIPAKGTIVEFVSIIKDFLNNIGLESRLGEAYKLGKIQYVQLKCSLQSKQCLMRCLDVILEDYVNCQLEKEIISLSDFRNVLDEALIDVTFEIKGGRRDGVLVTDAIKARGIKFKYIFLMGMREGEFPKNNRENWIYDDAEREELKQHNVQLPMVKDAYAEDYYFFWFITLQACEQLVLTWFEDSSAVRSVYVGELQKHYINLETEEIFDKEPASIQEALMKGRSNSEDFRKEWLGELAERAAMVDEIRLSETEYTGVLSDENLINKVKAKIGSNFSASMLEGYAHCPFSFLAQKVWGVNSYQEKEEVTSPAEEGTLIHEVLANFIGKHLHEKLVKYDRSDLWEELKKCFDEECAKLGSQGNSAKDIFQEAEHARLKNLLLKWLMQEYYYQTIWNDFVPYEVEWEFSIENNNPLKLTLNDKSTINIQGRIDRMDGNGNNIFVTDYKRSWAPSGKDVEKGLDLQMPIYMLAVDEVYGKSAAGGGYFVLKDGNRKSSFELSGLGLTGFTVNKTNFANKDEFMNFSRKLISTYVEEIYKGNFMVHPKESCPAFCPLIDICRFCGKKAEGEQDE